MLMKDRKLSPEALARWDRRSQALEAGTILLSRKPNRELWTEKDYRVFRYAAAVSLRIEKLQ